VNKLQNAPLQAIIRRRGKIVNTAKIASKQMIYPNHNVYNEQMDHGTNRSQQDQIYLL
jgi:DNA gyrase/topoisomerase IV subunit B